MNAARRRWWVLFWLIAGVVALALGWMFTTLIPSLLPYRPAVVWFAFGLPPLGFLVSMFATRCAGRSAVITATLLVAMVAAVSIGFDAGRRWALLHYGTAAADEDWRRWRNEVVSRNQAEDPVARRVPKSEEPPFRVLMRDHYDVCLLGAMLLSTAMFGFGWVVTLGMLSGRTRIYDDSGRREA